MIKELFGLKSLHCTTIGEDLFSDVCETVKEFDKTEGDVHRRGSKYDCKENRFDS
jgi:hypothetical protein